MRRLVLRSCCLALLCLSLAFVAACDDEESTSVINYDDIDNISFSEHVQPILAANCVTCHGGTVAEAGLRLDSWENIIKGSDNGEALIAFDAENSRMIRMLTSLRGGAHPTETGENTLLPAEQTFLTRWINEGAINDDGDVAYADATELLYVCCQNSAEVRIIDMESNNVIRVVDFQELGYTADCKPHHVAVEPDGSFWYVSLIGDDKIVKLNARNEVVTDIDMIKPGLLELSSDDVRIYISRSMTAPQGISTLAQVDRTTMQAIIGDTDGEIPVQFGLPHALELSSDGRYLMTASLVQGAWMIHDTQTDNLTSGIIEQSSGPLEAEISPDGRTVFYTGQVSGKLYAFDIEGAELTNNTSIELGSKPWHMDFSPDGNQLYVPLNGQDQVAIVLAKELSLRTFVAGNGLALPHGVVAPDNGEYVYVSNRNANGAYTPRHDFGDNSLYGTVAVISTATDEIVKVLEVSALPTGINIAGN